MAKLLKKILSYLIVIAVLLVLCFDWGQVFYKSRQENAVIFSHCDELAKFYTN